MEVIKYLKEHGIGKLVSEFSIKVKEYPEEGLLVLNYDQIESPKAHPIVMECRSLILDYDFNVVSRSFDRFFNLGEQPDTQAHIDWSQAVCYDKIDGSLIKIYKHKGVWHVATRGTAFAESQVGANEITFKDLVFKAIGITSEQAFQSHCNFVLDEGITYICEVTSFENRVVRHYEGYNLYYLSSRDKNGNYKQNDVVALNFGMKLPKLYRFNGKEECENNASQLKDLDEGYVLYQDGVPVCKIKSPAYIAVHHLRGEGLNPKRISQLVLTNEQEEYLKYFPEDREYIEPYVKALDFLKGSINLVWHQTKDIESQKDFALAVKNYCFSAVLFQVRKNGKSVDDTFNEQTETHKIRMLETVMEAFN